MGINPSKHNRRYSHPTRPHGYAQIALSDLLLMTIGVGSVMMVWRNLNEFSFFPAGVIVSGLIGVLGMYCLLIAARHGISSRLSRWGYAIGAMMLGSGLLFGGVSCIWLIAFILRNFRETWIALIMAFLAIVLLVGGFVCQSWAWRRHRQSLEIFPPL